MIVLVPGDRLPAVPGGAAMTTTTTNLVPSYLDMTGLALASFLGRYRDSTSTAYTRDVKAFLGWCPAVGTGVLRVTRGSRDVRAEPGRSRIRRRHRGPQFGAVASFLQVRRHRWVLAANPAAAVPWRVG